MKNIWMIFCVSLSVFTKLASHRDCSSNFIMSHLDCVLCEQQIKANRARAGSPLTALTTLKAVRLLYLSLLTILGTLKRHTCFI